MNINKKTEKVRFFEAHCSDCNDVFSVPLLSDFAYGEFILVSKDGKAFVYMNSIVEKSFDLISDLFRELNSTEKQQDSQKYNFRSLVALIEKIKRKRKDDYLYTTMYLHRLHWTIAQCADEVDGQKLTNQFRCPKCRSTNVLYGDSVVVKDDLIPVVSFDKFNALSRDEKKDKVCELYIASKDIFQAPSL